MHCNPIWLVVLQKREIWTHRKTCTEQMMWRRRGDAMCKPGNAWDYQKLGERPGTPRPEEGINHADTLMSHSQAPELWNHTFLLFKLPVYYFVTAALGDWHKGHPSTPSPLMVKLSLLTCFMSISHVRFFRERVCMVYFFLSYRMSPQTAAVKFGSHIWFRQLWPKADCVLLLGAGFRQCLWLWKGKAFRH